MKCLQLLMHFKSKFSSNGHQITMLEKKRKDYAFRRQFNEKPSIITGCPENHHATRALQHTNKVQIWRPLWGVGGWGD